MPAVLLFFVNQRNEVASVLFSRPLSTYSLLYSLHSAFSTYDTPTLLRTLQISSENIVAEVS